MPFIDYNYGGQSPIGVAAMGALGKFADAYGNIYSSQGQGFGNLGSAHAQNTQAVAQGMSGLGNAFANAYGSMAGGLGSVANAMANERSNFYTSNAMAEAARQQALGNLSTAALNSYGGAANAAMGAWAQNQNAYNQAMSGLGMANQTGLSSYGASRNQALGQLGQSYANLGGKLAGASALQGMTMDFGGGGGGGFSATGPGGTVASGSYGGSGGGGGLRFSGADVGQQLRPAFDGLESLRKDAMAGDITGSMNSNLQDGYNRLDLQHYTSRQMPSQMLGQTLSGLMQLGTQGYGSIGRGMDQYYAAQNDPRNRNDFSGLLDRLSTGYDQARGELRPFADRISSAFTASNSGIGALSGPLKDLYTNAMSGATGALGELFNSSLANLELFQTPLQRAKAERDADLFRRASNLRDQVWQYANSPLNNDWSRGVAEKFERQLASLPRV